MIRAVLPVPRPLQHAVNRGVFGHDDRGKPIRPCPQEVREITETHAEKLIEGSDAEIETGVAKYAEDFGPRRASQLEAYVRRQRTERGR